MNARHGIRCGQYSLIFVAIASLVWWVESSSPSAPRMGRGRSGSVAEAQQNLTGIVDLPVDHVNLSTPGTTWLGAALGGGTNGGQLGYFPWRGGTLANNEYSTALFLIKPDELLTTGDLGGIAWQYVANTQGGGDHDVTSASVTYDAFIRIGRARPGWGALVPALELNFDDDFQVDYVLKAANAQAPLPGLVPQNGAWGQISHSGGSLFGFQSISFSYIIPDTNVPYVMEIITGGSDPSPTAPLGVGANTYIGNQNGFQHSHPGSTEFVDGGGWELNTTVTNSDSWGFASSSSIGFPPAQGTISPDKFPTLRLLFISKLTSSGGNKLHGGGGGSCFVESAKRRPASVEAQSIQGFSTRFDLANPAMSKNPTVVSGASASQGLTDSLHDRGMLANLPLLGSISGTGWMPLAAAVGLIGALAGVRFVRRRLCEGVEA